MYTNLWSGHLATTHGSVLSRIFSCFRSRGELQVEMEISWSIQREKQFYSVIWVCDQTYIGRKEQNMDELIDSDAAMVNSKSL